MSEQNQKINSRLNKNNRKKKTNTILNVLIGVVLLLIIIVVVNLVTGDKEEKDIAQEPKETESVSESSEVEEEESEDIELTTEMYKLLQQVNMSLVDHVIVSRKDIYSFVGGGMMNVVKFRRNG